MNTEPGTGHGTADPALLRIERLGVAFRRAGRPLQAVREVSMDVRRGDRLAIIGESGSGKTMTTLAMLGLLPEGAGVSGSLTLDGTAYDPLDATQVTRVVRARMAAVFQDSLSGLNPIIRVGEQLREVLTLRGVRSEAAQAQVLAILKRVGITDPELRARAYPHELSGGMRQRVMIALALLAQPALLIADEPTTALDALVQAQVIDLILELQQDTGMALILITHDIALAADVCTGAMVLYAGHVMESAPMAGLLARPGHPYTAALLAAMPRLDSPRGVLLQAIDGEAPGAQDDLPGCPFAPRCTHADSRCTQSLPPLRPGPAGGQTRCLRIDEIAGALERRAAA